ncbi:MAG: hypothetical protein SGARI_007074, partial [Bacillariaceae sp.]
MTLSAQHQPDQGGNDTPPVTYTVLYYKRKNKVHKSKGVSKMDGTLTVRSPPKAGAVLKDDVGSVIFQSSTSSDFARKGDLVDETVSLGGYEVEILSVEGPSLSPMPAPTKANVFQPKRTIFRRPPLGNTLSASAGLPSKKRSYLDRKTPQPQPKLQSLPVKRHKQITSAAEATTPSAVVAATSQNPALPKKPLPAFQRPRKIGQKATRPVIAAASSVSATEQNGLFPNAVGQLSVPVSIKTQLRPHQIEGVTFLWNAITGHSKVEQVSPH